MRVGDHTFYFKMATDFHSLLEIDIGDVLNPHTLIASEPTRRNPGSLHHFLHQKASEYFVMDIPLLDVHQASIGYYGVLDIDAVLGDLVQVEEHVVQDFDALGGRWHIF